MNDEFNGRSKMALINILYFFLDKQIMFDMIHHDINLSEPRIWIWIDPKTPLSSKDLSDLLAIVQDKEHRHLVGTVSKTTSSSLVDWPTVYKYTIDPIGILINQSTPFVDASPIKAVWNLNLYCECPSCKIDVDLLDAPDFWEDRTFEPTEFDTERTKGVKVDCPECGHSFLVDLAY